MGQVKVVFWDGIQGRDKWWGTRDRSFCGLVFFFSLGQTGSAGVVSRGGPSLEAISIARDGSAGVLLMALFFTVNAAVFSLSAIFFLGEMRVFLLELGACREVVDIYSERAESIGFGGVNNRAVAVITTSTG